MGSTSSAYSEDVINNTVSKFIQDILITNNMSVSGAQTFDMDNVNAVNFNNLNMTQEMSLNVAQLSTTEINETNMTTMATKLGEALKQFQKGGTGQVSDLTVANTIKSTVESEVNLSTIKKDIMKVLTEQRIHFTNIIKFHANDITMTQNMTTIRKIITDAVSKSNLSSVLTQKLNLSASISQTGFFSAFVDGITGFLEKFGEFGIAAIVAVFIVILLILFG